MSLSWLKRLHHRPSATLELFPHGVWATVVDNDMKSSSCFYAISPNHEADLISDGIVVALREAISTIKAKLVHIQLSAHFCRYITFDQNTAIKSKPEIMGYAKHRLRSIYGDSVATWSLRLTKCSGRWLVCGIDTSIISDISGVLVATSHTISSIQPRFSNFANTFKGSLGSSDGWLVLAEEDIATIALIHNYQWQHLTTRRIDIPGIHGLLDVIDRERQQIEEANDVYRLWIGGEAVISPEIRHYQISELAIKDRKFKDHALIN